MQRYRLYLPFIQHRHQIAAPQGIGTGSLAINMAAIFGIILIAISGQQRNSLAVITALPKMDENMSLPTGGKFRWLLPNTTNMTDLD